MSNFFQLVVLLLLKYFSGKLVVILLKFDAATGRHDGDDAATGRHDGDDAATGEHDADDAAPGRDDGDDAATEDQLEYDGNAGDSKRHVRRYDGPDSRRVRHSDVQQQVPVVGRHRPLFIYLLAGINYDASNFLLYCIGGSRFRRIKI